MRIRARVDANQKKIVSQLRETGCSVLHTHQLGKGAPDIIVGYNLKNYLVEIKDGDKPIGQQKLTPDEVKFQSEWKGNYYVVNSFDKLRDIIFKNEL
jgi:Holliday junction resolvase|tara:strand:+ start:304 stop:594 length:291 start_codon:yes stop_codon:yes gene_type:complete